MVPAEPVAEMKAAGRSAGISRAREHLIEGRPRDIVVKDRIAELFELVEDDIQRIVFQLPALVIDLLDVRFAARAWR